MANADTYRGDGPFFPLQGPRVQRGNDVRIPMDAANVEYPPISKRLTQSDEDAVWAQYEAMPPSSDAMEKASNVHGSRRWVIPAIVGAAFAIGIGYAALSDRPAAVEEPALAASDANTTDTSAAALMGGASSVGDPNMTPQSTFNASQPTTVSPPPSSTPQAVEPAQRAAPTPRAVKTAPAPVVEPSTPAPTYSRGEAPAAAPLAPAPAPEVADPALNPIPLPSAPAQEPALNLDLAPSSETIPAPGSVPENAQSPQ